MAPSSRLCGTADGQSMVMSELADQELLLAGDDILTGDCAPTCLAAGMQTGRNIVWNTPDCCFVRVPKVREGIQFHPVKWIRQNTATELPYCASKAAVGEATPWYGRSHMPACCIPCLYLSSASLAPSPYSAKLMDDPSCWTRTQELRCWSHPPWTPHELQMARSLSMW